MPFYFDPIGMLILLPGFALALWAQWRVRSTMAKFHRIRTRAGQSGADVARSILSRNGLTGVGIEEIGAGDHYDPSARTLRLSSENFRGPSITAVGVAAHEAGHALQHQRKYVPLGFRSTLFPVANIGSKLAFPLLFVGLIVQMPMLLDIGILLFAFAVLFSVVTLPVEFNASRRALVQLREGGHLASEELVGAKKVLDAAALTYVAATAVAVLQLVRLLLLRGRND